MEQCLIRSATAADAAAICAIYNDYVLNTTITFEEAAVEAGAMRERIEETLASLPFLVCLVGDEIVGYAYAGKWKGRCAYRHTVETSIYLKTGRAGHGLGSALYRELLADVRRRGVHAVIAGIALPNEPSRCLHEKFGFVQVAHFREVGFKFGRWLDVGYWQLLLEQT